MAFFGARGFGRALPFGTAEVSANDVDIIESSAVDIFEEATLSLRPERLTISLS